MNPNKIINLSQQAYTSLLRVYPGEHRQEYGPLMTQLFADQCKAACRQHGWLGWVALWGRTLLDICRTAPAEHLYSSRARWNLALPNPIRPVPWKAVAVILLPGLFYLIAQVGQVAGKDWYLPVLHWGGYILMLPVIAAWLITRKFPVWGLIPLGVFAVKIESFFDWQVIAISDIKSRAQLKLSDLPKPLHDILYQPLYQLTHLLPDHLSSEVAYIVYALIGLSVIGLLVWLNSRQHKMKRAAWLWLGLYFLLILISMGIFQWRDSIWWNHYASLYSGLGPMTLEETLYQMAYILESNSVLMLLILLGSFLARRHGRLAVLLSLGYLLAWVIYGWTDWQDPYVNFYLLNAVLIIWRLSMAVAIPLWMLRAASVREQNRAVIIPLVIALAASTVLDVQGYLRIIPFQTSGYMVLSFISLILEKSLPLIGFALALTLYRPVPTAKPEVGELQTPEGAVA